MNALGIVIDPISKRSGFKNQVVFLKNMIILPKRTSEKSIFNFLLENKQNSSSRQFLLKIYISFYNKDF